MLWIAYFVRPGPITRGRAVGAFPTRDEAEDWITAMGCEDCAEPRGMLNVEHCSYLLGKNKFHPDESEK